MKMPRWDLNKFKGAENRIGTEMKSVGEVMSIGRSFEEVLQKAIRSLSIGKNGFVQNGEDLEKSWEQIKNPTNTRIFALANVLHHDNSDKTVEKIYNLSKIDKWFLYKMQNIVKVEKEILKNKTLKKLDKNILQLAKKTGFSDKQIAKLTNSTEEKLRDLRKKLKVLPVVKQIDTLAGEFPTETNYLYLTYHGSVHDINFQRKNSKKQEKKQIVVLGSGPYCIGSSAGPACRARACCRSSRS
jgi:carbamoyl-phosphate synthase large subunit